MKIGSAYIEITNRCNLNCATCYNQSGMNSVTRELELSGIRRILDILPAYGCRSISFSGGEPLLHSKIYALMELLKAYPEQSFSFVTNGTLLTRELAEKAARIKNIHFCISVFPSLLSVYSLNKSSNCPFDILLYFSGICGELWIASYATIA